MEIKDILSKVLKPIKELGAADKMSSKDESLSTKKDIQNVSSSAEFDMFKSVFDNSSYVFVIGSLNGRIIYHNTVLPRILGLSQDNFANQMAEDVVTKYVHPDDIELTNQAVSEAIHGQSIYGFENRYRVQNGSYIWLSWMLIPFANEKVFYAFAHEITEQKKLDKSLEDERKRLYALLDGLPGLVYVRTSDGTVIFANRNFKEIHGEPDTKKCYKILFNQDDHCIDCRTKLIRSDAQLKILMQWQIVIKDTIFEVFEHPFQDSDGRQLFLMQLLDITKRKVAEEEVARLDRLNLVGELAASIAHEVRNPMTTVRGFLQILKSRDTLNENEEYFDLMISELDRANSILTEFLSIAKTKTKTELYIKGKLNNLVNSLYPLILADATNQDKQVLLVAEEVAEFTMIEREIRQLILNLTRNGLEAMPAEGILKIMTYMEENSIVLAVEDQGIGISEDNIARLGTPFLTTKVGGTGLGLTTCYSIAERHNAKISVQSSSSGTVFIVRFKLN